MPVDFQRLVEETFFPSIIIKILKPFVVEGFLRFGSLLGALRATVVVVVARAQIAVIIAAVVIRATVVARSVVRSAIIPAIVLRSPGVPETCP